MRIATYNVENLFDLHFNHSEYVEYIPKTSWQWNATTYRIKLDHIAKTIIDINADIIALQEIESAQALKDLKKRLNQQGLYYPYSAIADAKESTVKVALLSKYPLAYSKELWVTSSLQYRNILEAKILVDKHPIYLFVNHWKSKSGSESKRIISAKVLKKRLQTLGYDKAIIVLGDFNSHYDEASTFVRKRKLNDTNGITGINHILNTTSLSSNDMLTCKECLYNLWYDTPIEKRWSHIYRKQKEALDNIIVSAPLLQNQGFIYRQHSIKHADLPYLLKKENPYRWQYSKTHPKHHIGKGYSDHLPVYADFTLTSQTP